MPHSFEPKPFGPRQHRIPPSSDIAFDELAQEPSVQPLKRFRLKAIYATLGHVAYKTISPFMKYYMKPSHVRVRVLILNDQNEVLLVRSWMGSQRWNLPGGGIEAGETPAQAAVREIKEETGLEVEQNKLKELGQFTNTNPKAPFTIACFKVVTAKQTPAIIGRRKLEMLDAAWFNLDNLPQVRSKVVDKALELSKF